MCFADCISDFTSRVIKGKEVSVLSISYVDHVHSKYL